ncbi:MAG: hypothetical protein WCZ23_15720, partial [Rhodospirillaceae bacterium]
MAVVDPKEWIDEADARAHFSPTTEERPFLPLHLSARFLILSTAPKGRPRGDRGAKVLGGMLSRKR